MQVVSPSPTAMYTGISNAMITISRVEGFRTLWRGLSSVILGAGPAHAVYFASYEAVKHRLGGNQGGSEEHHPFAAGAYFAVIRGTRGSATMADLSSG
jgi:asparaginyl-tRNA synthetase